MTHTPGHSIKCSYCRNAFTPTAYQVRKCIYQCLPCRREYEKQWRVKRKAAGNRVISTRMPITWEREYRKDYYKKEEVKLRRASNMRKYRNDPTLKHKHEARDVVGKAVKRGPLKKKPCVMCGELKSQAHHSDYSKPLEVTWLCRPCHRSVHAQTEGRL